MEESELAAVAPAGSDPSAEPPVDAKPVHSARSHVGSKQRARIADLMTVHGEAILGFCMRMVQDEPAAQDILQQTFLQAYRDLDRFEGRASLRTWLISIARHRCLDALKYDRRLQKRIESDEQATLAHLDPTAGAGERLDRARLHAMLEQCVRKLPDVMRSTLLERFTTGFTYEELARSLGTNANTLQVRVARALRRLKTCLEKHGWSHD